jgi:serine/threonine-protein kinase
MPTYSDILFGKIALTNRLVTTGQLNDCVAKQARGRGLTLAEVMIQDGLLTPAQARRVQKAQALTQFMRAEKIFARIALDRGLADVNTLRAAFSEQQRSNFRVRLAQLLVDRRALTTAQVDEVVDEQLLQLAEETARIEEAGFSHESAPAVDEHARKLEEMTQVGLASDLDGSTFRSAVGPSGLMDDEALNRTMPAMATRSARARPDESAGARERRVAAGAFSSRAAAPEAPLDPANLTGAVIASRYRVMEKVGEGGMGTVYRAQHCLMDKIVALKVLHPSLVSSKSSLDRFRREIRAASRFQHKNVIQLYDAGEGEGGIFYMAMEFAEGETLEDLLRRKELPLERSVDIMCQVLSAIAEAHKKGIVHRDLKSGNIMMVKGKAREDIAKVTDFGLAKIAQDSSEGGAEVGGGGLFKTQEGVVTGTPQYMSPEQASGEPVDHRSDLYSLGVILFELLTGELPFKSNTPMGFLGKHIVEPPPVPSEVAPRRGISRDLDEITLKLLEKKPGDRFQTAESCLDELERRCGSAPLAVPDRRSHKERRQRQGGETRRDKPERRQRSRDRRKGGKTRVMPSDRDGDPRRPEPESDPMDRHAPVAMTMEVEGPPPSSHPGTQDLGVTIEAPPPAAPEVVRDEPAKGKGLVLVAVMLGVLLAAVVGVAGYLATRLQGESAVAAAEKVLEDDPAKASELLEAWLTEHPDDAEAKQLLGRAQALVGERDFERLVARADQLAEEWRQGTNGGGGGKARELYQEALALRADAGVQTRLAQLEGELNPQPTATPSSAPSATPSASPSDQAEQRAILTALGEALAGGQLDTAEGLLGEAEQALGESHPKLEHYRQYLKAERLILRARQARDAGSLPDARRLYQQAKRAHPEAEGRSRADTELAPVLEQLAGLEASERVEDALAEAREQAIALEVTQARRTLAGVVALAKKQDEALVARYTARRSALAKLEPLAIELGERRAQTTAWERGGPSKVKAEVLRSHVNDLTKLRQQIAEALAGDAPLGEGLRGVAETELTRARDFLAAVEKAQPVSADPYRARFQRIVKRLRAAADARETRNWIAERLDAYRSAREHPGYANAGDEEKQFVRDGLAHYEGRWSLWLELGSDWAFVPGGTWTSPTGEAHELPAGGVFLAFTELTCADWDKYLRATGRKRPRSFPGPTDQPVTWISKEEAQRYCRWRTGESELLSYRLPTAGEWERAARGDKGTEFPWGDAFEKWRVRGQDHAAIAGMRLQRVRSIRNDKNDWDIWDVVGNAQELTSTVRDGQIVLKGGSISHSADQCGAGYLSLVPPGLEVQPFVGLRLVAEEK